MANQIVLKNSSVSGSVPSNAQLDRAELALNIADGVVFTKKSNDQVAILNPLRNLVKGKDGTTVATGNAVTGNLLVDYDFVGAAKTIPQSLTNLCVASWGSDTLNIGTIDRPYQSIQKAITLINGSGNIDVLPGAYLGSLPVTSSNIQITGAGLNGKNLVTINGKVSTSGSVTRVGLKDCNLSNGSGIVAEFLDTAGRHTFNNVAIQCDGVTAITTGSTFANWLTFKDCDFTASTGVVALPALSGSSATATFVNCSGLQLTVGFGWSVYIISSLQCSIVNNGGTVYIVSCPGINVVNNSGQAQYLETMPAVRYDIADQGLTTQQKSNARSVIGCGTAATKAIEFFILAEQRGQANGVASLGSDGLVPASQLPAVAQGVSSVDGATGAVTTNAVKVIAQTLTSPQKVQAKTNLDLQNVDNTSDANKPISTATQNALNLKLNTADQALTFIGAYSFGSQVAAFNLNSVFSSTYDDYLIQFYYKMVATGIGGFTNTFRLRANLADDTTANYSMSGQYSGASAGTPSNSGQTSWNAMMGMTGNNTQDCLGSFILCNPFAASTTYLINGTARYKYNGSDRYSTSFCGDHLAATSFDGLSFLAADGFFSTIKVKVYGYRKS